MPKYARFINQNGLYSICANCKRIKSQDDSWREINQEDLDALLKSRKVTHSICPECVKILYPWFDRKIPK
jgi:hypothetical protein